jgi:ubiquinone/menaquinone biosynthesis C-methylase UbiE
MESIMDNQQCLLCKYNNTSYVFTFSGKDAYLEKLNVTDFKLNWYKCNHCKVFFSTQYSHINQVYEDVSLYDAAYDEKSIKERYTKIINLPSTSSDNAQRVQRCKDYHQHLTKLLNIQSDHYQLLDIGAGLGVFISKFMDQDYQCSALELNQVASNHIQSVLPSVTVYQDYMQNLNFENTFDLITMNRVLEHIETPIDVMIEVYRALKPNGMVYLELPDTLSYYLDGDSNEAFASGHYMVYSDSSIYFLFEQTGLKLMKLERIQEPSGKYTIYAIGIKNEIL